MIISKSPFRISFFGGSTDYEDWFTFNGGAFISLAFQKYSYSVVKRLPKNSEKKYHVQWRIKEATNNPDNIKQMPIFIAMAEYGQVGFYGPDAEYTSGFMKNSLNLDSKEPTNLSNLVYQDSNMPYNPTTYIPNTDNLSNSDIFIIHDCYGSNFIRKVMTILEADGFGDSRQLAQNFDDMPDSMSA